MGGRLSKSTVNTTSKLTNSHIDTNIEKLIHPKISLQVPLDKINAESSSSHSSQYDSNHSVRQNKSNRDQQLDPNMLAEISKWAVVKKPSEVKVTLID